MKTKMLIALFFLNTFIFASDSNERFSSFEIGHFFKKEAPFIDVVYDKVTKSWFYSLPTERQEIINIINNGQIDFILKLKNSYIVENFPHSKYNPFLVMIIPKLIDDKDENNKPIKKSIILIQNFISKVLYYIEKSEDYDSDWENFKGKLDKFVKKKREYEFIKTKNPIDPSTLLLPELIKYIIYLMDDDALVFYLVSKDWQKLVKNSLTKIDISCGYISIRDLEMIKKQVDLKLIKNVFPYIKSLRISENVPKNFNELGSFTNLESLTLMDIMSENDKAYYKEVLNLSGLTNLKKLSIDELNDVDEESIRSISLLTKLECLDVLYDGSTLDFDIGKLKNLKKAYLDGVSFDERTWKDLASLKNLNSLEIQINDPNDDIEEIKNLSQLINLKSFILEISNDDEEDLEIDFSFLFTLTNLTNLKLTCVNDKMLLKLQKAFTNLKCLNIK